ncbi:MAG: hypothetical protein V3T31_00130 [candidate division Zixibacteria bacterium]
MRFTLVLTLIFILVFSVTTFGQGRKTLIQGDIDHGFYVSQSTKFTGIDGEFAPLLGGRAGWIIDHTFAVGGAGYSALDKIDTDFLVSERPVEILLAYGGLQLMYIGNSHQLVQYEVGTLVGFGGLNYRGSADDADLPNSDHIFVIEPEAVFSLNITDYLQVSSGLSYRWVSGIDYDEVVKDSELSGLATSLMLSFGKF